MIIVALIQIIVRMSNCILIFEDIYIENLKYTLACTLPLQGRGSTTVTRCITYISSLAVLRANYDTVNNN